MNEYEIVVKTSTTVYVCADSEKEARRLAKEEATQTLPDKTTCRLVAVTEDV